MYKITKIDGTEVGYTDTVIYIKIAPNGCFIQTTKDNATGVAYDSTPYSLFGSNGIDGADTVIVTEVDSARYEKPKIRADIDYLAVMAGVSL